ncbi:MAG: NHLP leader peptide family RiPP precursor [Bryobacteraceae bacterium]
MPTVQEALDRVWSDEGLKRRLLTDPKPVLAEFGLQIPDDVKVQIHENTPHLTNAVLVEKPADASAIQANDPVRKIVQRAWTDSAFKARLLANPKEIAQEMGLKLSPDMDLKVWENTPTVHHMVLPVNPADSELNDADLETIAGGGLSKAAQSAAGSVCDRAVLAVGGVSMLTSAPIVIGMRGVGPPAPPPGPTGPGSVAGGKGKL